MTMAVLYDPEDHHRVALDIAATKKTVAEQSKALWEREDREEKIPRRPHQGIRSKRSSGSHSYATKER
jgi:hypothetical protein